MKNDPNLIYRELCAPYDVYAQTNQWDLYISKLLTDGLKWFFNLNVQILSLHLKPLTSLPTDSLPNRLIFLKTALSPETPAESYDVFHSRFKESENIEYAIAACVAAVTSIIHEGHAWDRFNRWYIHLSQASNSGESVDALARASAKVTMGIIDTYCRGDYRRAATAFKSALSLAEKSPAAISLKVYLTAHFCFCYLQTGCFSEIELVLFDTDPLVNHPDASPVSRFHYRDILGLFKCRSGKIKEGKWILIEIEESPVFSMLPLGSRFLKLAHLMEAAITDYDRVLIIRLADRMKVMSIPGRSFFYLGYRHCYLAIAKLAMGEPLEALQHLQILAERPEFVEGFGEQEYRHALLTGQALADLNWNREAAAHFEEWVPRMEESGKFMFASAAHLEWAGVLMHQGEIDEARHHFDAARSLQPNNEFLTMIYRPPSRLEDLKRILFSRIVSMDCYGSHSLPPIRIFTFGDLRLEICGQMLPERDWRGSRVKMLLKALIVQGGAKVPLPVLADLLWPDTDGDRAVNSVRVTITRLRKVACRKGGKPLPWIKVKHGHVSLCTPLCNVDCILFEKWGCSAAGNSDMPLLKKTLDFYTDDFLKKDSEGWIVRCRRRLRKQFIKWVTVFTDHCMKKGKNTIACDYLTRASQKVPLDETVCARLIHALLKTGRRSQAIRTYQQAERNLMKELGIEPGRQLLSLYQEILSYTLPEN